MTELTVTHALYLADRRHRRETTLALRRLIRKRRPGHLTVVHDNDGACCRAEPWATTAQRMQRQLAADGDDRTLWLFAA